MADPKFFDKRGPFFANELATLAGDAELIGDASVQYSDVAALDKATSSDVSFLDNRKYLSDFRTTQAGLCIVHPDLADQAPEGTSLLVTKQPYMAYALISRAFYPDPTPTEAKIASSAFVSETAEIAYGVTVGSGAFIGENVKIGPNTWIMPNAVINDGVEIGADCRIYPNVTITHSIIGNGVTVNANCAIGQEGFGFASGPQGHVRIPQMGRVLIHDHVNIGANTTIDRGAGPDTVIGAGTQIDNLVQIGHNVQIGMGCVIVSQSGISGSTKLGNFVVMGGQVGIAGHLSIEDGATIAAKAGVMKNVSAGSTVGGFPAINQREWLRQTAALSKLAKNKK